ncbi:hypothetical protein QBZ16_004087 [Prototheca wickerhamii]|uniref:Uncharacterized protein n=1 Tax=Prototheca wickerhamii TaxID=3111 RepID=A0AAD9IH75_PROWI|nr:hypothetical protein QBZ16_004087 [Prototheca wickerhamii]
MPQTDGPVPQKWRRAGAALPPGSLLDGLEPVTAQPRIQRAASEPPCSSGAVGGDGAPRSNGVAAPTPAAPHPSSVREIMMAVEALGNVPRLVQRGADGSRWTGPAGRRAPALGVGGRPPGLARAASPAPAEDALGAMATLFPAALRAADGADLLRESSAALQEQGRKMKRLAENKMVPDAGGRPRPTHVSAYFLAQAGLKFLASAVALERELDEAARLFSKTGGAAGRRADAPTLYRQTAALLDAAGRSAQAAASGPPLVTAATALLCERLAAVARLRARGLGETFLRGSPTDSAASTSTTAGAPAPGLGAAPDAADVLVPLPRETLEAQRESNRDVQDCAFAALSALARSSDRLGELVQRAEREGSAPGLKAAVSLALITCDAGVGNPAPILGFARAALADIVKII